MKATRLAAASVALIAFAALAIPAHAAQPQATDEQNAVAFIVYQGLKQSKASDPKEFKSACNLFKINPTKALNLLLAEKEIKESVGILGVTLKDFRAGTSIALKKACA